MQKDSFLIQFHHENLLDKSTIYVQNSLPCHIYRQLPLTLNTVSDIINDDYRHKYTFGDRKMHLMRNAYEYLENTACRLPDKVAFADEKASYTFGELLTKSASAGTAIAAICESKRGIAAVIVDRTASSLLGFMSALACGMAYLPIDNRMPEARIAEILTQAHPAVILFAEKDRRIADKLSSYAPVLCIDEVVSGEADDALLTVRRDAVLDIDPAYVIFTSGSTGTPKGILISHRALIDFTEWMSETCKVSESDVLGNQAPFYFDLSVKDIYQTLRNGCTTHILPKKLFMFPMMLVDYLNERGVTSLIWATSAFRIVADSGVFEKKAPTTVKRAILGGEALQARHVNLWKSAVPDIKITNLYGPTEVTVDCTYYELDRDFADGEPIPIGKACKNKEIILLDEDLKPVKDGEPGEICVRGIGLALGYLGDGEKTAAAFIQNPLNPDYPDRLYRTGDIAKYNAEGELIFLSRRDDQIKHMGYRIELGEIETALLAFDGVKAGVCFFDPAEDQIVCVMQANGEADISKVATDMKSRVPGYMLPNVWRTVERMPLNPNGKIDRKLLKEQYFNEKN